MRAYQRRHVGTTGRLLGQVRSARTLQLGLIQPLIRRKRRCFVVLDVR